MTDHLLHVPRQKTATPGEPPPAEAEVTAALPLQTEAAVTVPVPVSVELHVEVACPGCGRTARIDAGRRDAQDFCATCDFPLFWAVERVPLPGSDPVGDSGLRRLPGTAGRAALAAVVCPTCTEPNAPSAVTCARCGGELRPAAPVPVVAEAPVQLVELPQDRRWWPLVLVALLVVTLLAGTAALLFA